jgi:proliferating cell nuclear antigen PCNA
MDSDNEDTLHIDFVTNQVKVEEDKNETDEKKVKKEDKKKEKKVTKGKNTNDKENKQFKKFFKVPLTENDYSELNIPVTEYDAEFSLSSKHIDDIFTQLNLFGNDIIVKCSEENIYLTTNGVTGEMRVEIPIDDVSSYSIVEGEEIELTYSLIYLNKMCITNKLSEEVEFSLSSEFPMKILYPLGEDSSISFYMAPKISDD